MNPEWFEIECEYDRLLLKPDKTEADLQQIENIEIYLLRRQVYLGAEWE